MGGLVGSTVWSAAKLAAWMTLAVIGLADVLRLDPSAPILGPALLAAGSIALVAFAATIVSAWRGPPLVAFSAEEARMCDGEDAEPVRAYAQVRGLIGGAGHVHPPRLALPAIAWVAALVTGLKPFLSPALEIAGPFPFALASLSAVATWLFPSRPYWYREVTGGGALVFPPEVIAALMERELEGGPPGVAAVHAVGQPAPLLREHPRVSPSDAEPVPPPRTTPRYALVRRLVVEQGGRRFEAATINVSDGGLAVRWPAEIPVLGGDIVVKVEEEGTTRAFDAVVRWQRPDGDREVAVGLAVRASQSARVAWHELVDRAANGAKELV